MHEVPSTVFTGSKGRFRCRAAGLSSAGGWPVGGRVRGIEGVADALI